MGTWRTAGTLPEDWPGPPSPANHALFCPGNQVPPFSARGSQRLCLADVGGRAGPEQRALHRCHHAVVGCFPLTPSKHLHLQVLQRVLASQCLVEALWPAGPEPGRGVPGVQPGCQGLQLPAKGSVVRVSVAEAPEETEPGGCHTAVVRQLRSSPAVGHSRADGDLVEPDGWN